MGAQRGVRGAFEERRVLRMREEDCAVRDDTCALGRARCSELMTSVRQSKGGSDFWPAKTKRGATARFAKLGLA